MTPTEQDRELRLEIARKVYPKPTPGEIMTWGTPEAVVEIYADSPIVYEFANFITADRERVALEARLQEVEVSIIELERSDDPRFYGKDEAIRSQRARYTQLKAQQEEV